MRSYRQSFKKRRQSFTNVFKQSRKAVIITFAISFIMSHEIKLVNVKV